jgi:hypothetical protein
MESFEYRSMKADLYKSLCFIEYETWQHQYSLSAIDKVFLENEIIDCLL